MYIALDELTQLKKTAVEKQNLAARFAKYGRIRRKSDILEQATFCQEQSAILWCEVTELLHTIELMSKRYESNRIS
jgi:hypothetical protein